ncbi:Uncharacterised protein [uncultured Prevotella sp.]|nr:Uncharacterised protein [uncultured Prevotella sp.]
MNIMELEKFINGFAEQFDETDISEIKADTDFHNLDEWSSLVAMGVIAFIKMEYNKTITGKDIKSCKSVKDLFNLIQSK